MTVNIDNDTAIEMLMDRVKFWTDDDTTIELFEEYYTDMVENDAYSEFDVSAIVDNDYINWFSVMDKDEYGQNFNEDIDDSDRIYAEKDGYYLVYVG